MTLLIESQFNLFRRKYEKKNHDSTGIGGLAAAFSASAFASTKLKGNEKMMPVDTLNHESRLGQRTC